jgi:hypothetical protein
VALTEAGTLWTKEGGFHGPTYSKLAVSRDVLLVAIKSPMLWCTFGRSRVVLKWAGD